MSLKSRACFACYGLGVIFTALSARVVHVAINQHEHYADLARKKNFQRVTLIARRGSIQDALGAYLARNEPLRNVILDGSLIKNPQKVAELLSAPLQMSKDEILARIKPDRQHVVLKKKISEEMGITIEKAIAKAGIKGVLLQQDFERIYPARDLASHVIGFFGYEERDPSKGSSGFGGIEGVERSMDNWLTGKDGWRCFERDGHGRELVIHGGEERPPRHGANVRLTLDLNLQQIVEAELAAACKRLRPLRASVVMMKPDTGEILALANRPNFDPNEPGKAKPEQRFNHAVAGTYEPGSTFKPVTAAGAINSHLATLNTELWLHNGVWAYGGKSLRDHHPYGTLTVGQIIEKSSNIGAAKLAVQLGEERFSNYVRAFGFGQRTGVALPGEAAGTFRDRRDWTGISITRLAMGHEISTTPLQMLTATCAIANGGRLMMPKLIHDIRDDDGNILNAYQPQEIRQAVTAATAAKICEALVKVTGKKGTAPRAHIPGFNVGGKTGTAQKYENGRPSHEHHVTSFVGFVPAEKPAFCMIVVIDQAQVKPWEDTGGTIAAPIFRSVAEKSLAYLGIQPDLDLIQREKEQELQLAKAGRN
ncbi:MAG: penicillin-binding protein 2 [Chthoniobacteraceae bacterium]